MNALVRHTPRGINLYRDFDAVLNSFFNEDLGFSTKVPAVDVRESEDGFVLEAELAGLTENDIDIDVKDHLLTISSKSEEKKEEKKNGYVLKERKSSSFSRSFILPKNADIDKIEANMKDGILTLNIPKTEEAKPKKITVKSK